MRNYSSENKSKTERTEWAKHKKKIKQQKTGNGMKNTKSVQPKIELKLKTQLSAEWDK